MISILTGNLQAWYYFQLRMKNEGMEKYGEAEELTQAYIARK